MSTPPWYASVVAASRSAEAPPAWVGITQHVASLWTDPGDAAYASAVAAGLAFAAAAAAGSLVFKSPYGKLTEGSALGGAMPALNLDPRLGWFLMELPATLSFWYFFLTSRAPHARDPLPVFLAALWGLHYANRGFFFPLSIRVAPGQKSSFSLAVVVIGWAFTALHGYLSATWYARLGDHLHLRDRAWLATPWFWIGLVTYQVSFWMTIHSEHIQRGLRSARPAPDEPRYKIPRGGAFEWCTCPTYLFELTGWLGFALMSLNPGGLVVLLVSAANLVPRAAQTHQWYLDTFDEYKKLRRARLVPFVW